ncbi:hypothetical protein [Brachybacterium fresconis]|uniref:Lipoprotein n=1 Tax=Brachybacterium fresconis TaxID=173363 RepID=A0ABS4YEU3_9MICO|nr:hypothetical protein [Brachybacterium fresconis]MBP2407298.1 hypothetical protein [Brachybacterium fresconis]
MRTRHRALTALAMASLVAFPLAACGNEGEEKPTEAATQEAPPSQDPADATPQERIEAYFEASDAAAAEGWKDSSYADDYLVPELAEKQKADDAERAETGTVITGDRKLSEWKIVNESGTAAEIEFCDDATRLEASKAGKPVGLSDESPKLIAGFKLTRDPTSEPWMIQKKGYYDEGTSCEAYFTD